MFVSAKLKIFLRLYILCTLAICLWFFSSKVTLSQYSGQFESRMPITTYQLQPMNGVIPVELKCENAELSAPNAIEKLSCVIKNNTQGYISAGALYTSLTLEQDGKTNINSSYDTFDTFMHPDFREEHKNNLIGPGKEYRVSELPVSYSEGVVVKGITVLIDYIEFADNSIIGNNHGGSRIIGNMREGAAKYKNWLAQEYKRNGMSIDSLVPLLDSDQPLPQELGFENAEQERGAIIYRKYALKTYKEKGAEGLVKHFNAARTSVNK